MILVVNLNLAIDHLIEVDAVRLGQVHRAKSTLRQAGGKGVNVMRVLATLGERAILAGFLGGRAGEFIAADLRAEDIACSPTSIQAESRSCLIVSDNSHQQTVINEPGPVVGSDELTRFTENYRSLLQDCELVVITGSLPPGLPAATYSRLISDAHGYGRRVLLDCTFAALRPALLEKPFLVKINHAEAGELLELSIEDFADALTATHHLLERGATTAMITLGSKGAVLAGGEGVGYKFVPPADLPARNSVGSGDAAMAGLAAGLRRGYSAEQSGVLAMAAGAANALHGFGRCTAIEISRLQQQVFCTTLGV